MRSRGRLAGAAVLFAALVLGYGGFAWVQTEDRVLAAAEAEGLALLDAVAAGIGASLDASRAVDRLLSARLTELSQDLERALAENPGREADVLARFAAVHRLRGAVLLDEDLDVREVAAGRAAAGGSRSDAGPFAAERIARLEAETLARRAAEAGLRESERVVIGFDQSPFGRRTEYLLGRRAPGAGGYVLLRLDATDLEAQRAEAGAERLLAEVAHGPAIAYLVVADEGNRVLAAGDPARVGEVLPAVASDGWRRDPSGRVLDVSVPVDWPGSGARVLRVGLVAEPVEAIVRGGRRNLAVTTLLLLVTGVGGLWLLGVRESRANARETRLRADLEERERFASLGRLAAGMAHEVRSPLNALSMGVQRIAREATPAEPLRKARFDDLHAAVRHSISRLDGTVREFLSLGSREASPAVERIALAPLVEECVAAEAPTAVVEPPDRDVDVLADRALLARALGNLLRNARQTDPTGTVRAAWRAVGDGVEIEVRDGGPGIPPADRAHVFEPFWSARRGGTGLGLTIARDAVERMGGTVTVGRAPEGGALFAIRLPKGGGA